MSLPVSLTSGLTIELLEDTINPGRMSYMLMSVVEDALRQNISVTYINTHNSFTADMAQSLRMQHHASDLTVLHVFDVWAVLDAVTSAAATAAGLVIVDSLFHVIANEQPLANKPSAGKAIHSVESLLAQLAVSARLLNASRCTVIIINTVAKFDAGTPAHRRRGLLDSAYADVVDVTLLYSQQGTIGKGGLSSFKCLSYVLCDRGHRLGRPVANQDILLTTRCWREALASDDVQ